MKTVQDIEIAVRSLTGLTGSNEESQKAALATLVKLQTEDLTYPQLKEKLISELSQQVAFIGAESNPGNKEEKLKAIDLILGLK